MYLLEYFLGHPEPFIHTNSVVLGVITIAHHSVGDHPAECLPAVALAGVVDRAAINSRVPGRNRFTGHRPTNPVHRKVL